MAVIIVYDPDNSIVVNRVIEFNPSANTPDYSEETNKLINPDLTSIWNAGIFTVPLEYWKYDGVSDVVEMSAGEKQLVNDSKINKQIFNNTYSVTGNSFTEVININQWYNLGENITNISCLINANRNISNAKLKLTLGTEIYDFQIYCHEKDIDTVFNTNIIKNINRAEFMNIKIELATNINSQINVKNIVIQVN